MKQIKLFIPILALFIFGCSKQGIPTIKSLNEETVNEIFDGGEVIPRPEATYEETDGAYDENVASNGAKFLCNGKKVKETVVIDQLTLNAFDDKAATNTASLYPGSIIKIKDYMEQGDLNGIGGIKRAPIKISSDLGDIVEVEDPSQRGNVDKKIKEMEDAAPSFAANVRSEVKEAYSLEQSMLHVGLDYRYLGNSVKGRFDFESNIEKHSFVIKFYQVYHTASIGNPESQSALFHEDVDPYKLNDVVAQSGPLGLITEVAYGRMLVGVFTYEGAEYNTSADIEAKFRQGFSQIDGEISTSIKNFFSTSTFRVSILGGDAQEATKVSGSGVGMESVQAVYDWMQDGGNDPSLGVPIQYKIRQLADPSFPLLAIGGYAEYEIPDCSKLPNYLVIKDAEVTSIQARNDENYDWDEGALFGSEVPDLIQKYQRYADGEWNWIADFEDQKWQDVNTSDLPMTLEVNIPVPEKHFRSPHVVQFYDADVLGLEYMNEIQFNFASYIKSKNNPKNDNAYPSEVRIEHEAYSVILHLEWSTK